MDANATSRHKALADAVAKQPWDASVQHTYPAGEIAHHVIYCAIAVSIEDH